MGDAVTGAGGTPPSVVFGPVPSRRLGRSMGINNIPSKHCSYSCVYCQVGRTTNMSVTRRVFYDPDSILRELTEKLDEVRAGGDAVDYVTVVPDGEPTLDINLGRLLDGINSTGVPSAVISNSSLITYPDVREELMRSSWVSLKADGVRTEVWKAVDRPHGALRLENILEGIMEFSRDHSGRLVTETMLVEGMNTGTRDLEALADFLAKVGPATVYLSVPSRPPAEPGIGPPSTETLNRAYQILASRLENVEYLTGYEGEDFSRSGELVAGLLSILAVHPMRESAVLRYLSDVKDPEAKLGELVRDGLVGREVHLGEVYYLLRPPASSDGSGG
ncbi:MAG: hypothetical protein AVO35_07745 [Candidatus Aegiribacteria sp. MLS_C]|nr:MAG: hypothetical protein AVO35_07745 [Candidatus Aegiribacteria sp. MLS_C]